MIRLVFVISIAVFSVCKFHCAIADSKPLNAVSRENASATAILAAWAVIMLVLVLPSPSTFLPFSFSSLPYIRPMDLAASATPTTDSPYFEAIAVSSPISFIAVFLSCSISGITCLIPAIANSNSFIVSTKFWIAIIGAPTNIPEVIHDTWCFIFDISVSQVSLVVLSTLLNLSKSFCALVMPSEAAANPAKFAF